MKQKLLLLLFFSLNVFAGNSDKTVQGPSIGLIMTGVFMDQNMIYFAFTIKNNGDQPLTNIYIDNLSENSSMLDIYYTFPPETAIPSLAPGEEDTISFMANKFAFDCYDMSQAKVFATAPGGVEVTDLSDPYDYYSDNPTESFYSPMIVLSINHEYHDNNGNSIVDVGDDVGYTYQVDVPFFSTFYISDENVTLDNAFGNGSQLITYGIHYITQDDVDVGYIFNGFNMDIDANCGFGLTGYDTPHCGTCPVASLPVLYPYTVKLTDLLPNRISGQVKFNSNSDNCASGTGFPNRKVVATGSSNSFATFTDASGNYEIYIPNTDTYQTTATENLNVNFSSDPASVSIVSSGEDVNYDNTDFCIGSATGFANLSVALVPIDHPRPGFSSHYRLYFWNNGSTALSGDITMVFDQNKAGFGASTPVQTTFAINTITWAYANLIPFEERFIDITLNILTPPSANDGDLLHLSATGTPVAGDAFPADNSVSFDQTIVNAFDPNDKTVLEGAFIEPTQTGSYLHYLTRFQNTGSASATTVVLKETLDADLDWTTFEPIAASHDYSIQIKNGNELSATFPNIDLPHSSANEAASHGWMIYRIKPKPGFTYGDIAQSKADIYFDFNLPITTNEVATQLAPLSVKSFAQNDFVIYPNPAQNYFIIKSNTAQTGTYELSDARGRILKRDLIQSNTQVDIAELQCGYYFITVESGNAKTTYKVIKQ
ncbi:T9SS type A sorting domain-containing protein [Flavobacterium caeni]|uniref:Por secretion system C-terminal sorting domain-containing protein n=1 Tax=Flavobacterium caeni TaxID=490189 RepID=A0A1G5HPY5_9FLAO|nr:T9SS type A sorting domain-containing protein [Flavobacterium caeni]SCY65509.1 Por secretion system C-terminal sorting domain-containing protein [Flavobacterium caeni]